MNTSSTNIDIGNPREGRRRTARTDKVIATRAQAMEARAKGATYKQIAEQLGISESSAHGHVTKALQEAAARTADIAHDYRQQQIDRLEGLYSDADAIDKTEVRIKTKAILIDRLNKLHGLDAPTKHVHTNGLDELAFSNATDGEALDRLRKARAELAEIDLMERRKQLVPMETVQASFDIIKRHLDRFGDNLRRYGNTSIPAPELLDKHNEMIRAIMADSERLKK
ncbi:MAG: hypothetical protein GX130_05265 [Candidatus Hydrogenedens sp.]|nr:hypothetical protein [Candidatus Hydrogenedens sp.]